MTLNARQQSFVDHFLITGNATESAKRAGYSAHTASQTGFDLLRNPKVTKAINEAERLRGYRLKLAQDYELLKAIEILEYALEPKKRFTQKGEPMKDPETGEYVTTKDVNGALNALNLIAKMRGKFLTDIITAPVRIVQGRPLEDWTEEELASIDTEKLPAREIQTLALERAAKEALSVY